MQPETAKPPSRAGLDPAGRHAACATEALVLLPLGAAGLVGVLGYLAPLVAQRTGSHAALLGFCTRLAAHRVPLIGGAALVVLAAWAGLQSAVVRRLFVAHPLVAGLLGKLLLFLPVVLAIGLLLWVVTTPLLAALSVKP